MGTDDDEARHPWRPSRALTVVMIVLVVAAAAGVTAFAVAVSRQTSAPGPVPPLAEDTLAADAAAAACAYLTGLFREQIAEDAPAPEVLAGVATAERDAEAAANADVRWRPLASGLGALRVSLERDDPDAARVAISVVNAECQH